jgi:pyridinium-3,5-biscarboxylic acid mononucleotide sulfurtransferase
MQLNIEEKYEHLKSSILKLEKAAVAFSGGVDSTLLTRVCSDLLGQNALAVTVSSPMLPASEIEEAVEFTKALGIKHIIIEEEGIDAKVAENPSNRCYFCKKIEFSNIKKAAERYGIETVLDGSNFDDLSDYRPGLKALKELATLSPLKEAGLTKADVREISKKLGLKTWNKPAFACLASRIPYGENITIEKLEKIEKSEVFLKNIGFRQFRVRSHDAIARIEVSPDEREKLFDTILMDSISKELKSYGFLYVCMELEGYKTGSLNSAIL